MFSCCCICWPWRAAEGVAAPAAEAPAAATAAPVPAQPPSLLRSKSLIIETAKTPAMVRVQSMPSSAILQAAKQRLEAAAAAEAAEAAAAAAAQQQEAAASFVEVRKGVQASGAC